MSATVTILREGTSESIQMYVNPDEKIEEIIDKCKDYWHLEGNLDDYLLIRGNTRLLPKKTIISSNIKEGDVVRFCDKDDFETPEMVDGKDRGGKDPISSAESWLKENIGVDLDNLEIIGDEDKGPSTKLLFRNLDRDKHYTVIIQNGEVKTYIPALVEDCA